MPRRIRTALFVDFDNIYISLMRHQPDAAQLFARGPDGWLRWLAEDGPVNYADLGGKSAIRRILVRRCYINPKPFSQFRSFFIRAGFEVVDCPALTAQGKTSADIHMVLDIVDTLACETAFDEFIILSADADFTPVLLRLRKHDRRTCVLAFGSVSPAYKAGADQVLDETLFLESALGLVDPEPSRQRGSGQSEAPAQLLRSIGERLLREIDVQSTLSAVELPGLYKEFEAFRSGESWLGFFSLRAMTDAIVEATPGLEIVEEDPWLLRRQDDGEDGRGTVSGLPSLGQIVEVVQTAVADSERPVSLAELANRIVEMHGPAVRESRWLHSGSFKKLVERLDLDGLELSSDNPPYLFDPTRHEGTQEQRTRDLPEVVRRVCQVTDVPQLTTEEYAVLFRKIASEINEHGYHLSRTSRHVRDSCHGAGVPVARSHVSFVLKGLAFCDHDFDEDQMAWKIGHTFVREVFLLCERAQVDLQSDEEETIHAWLLGWVNEEGILPTLTGHHDLPPAASRESTSSAA